MNTISNLELLNNISNMAPFNISDDFQAHHQLPMSYDDQILRAIGPNGTTTTFNPMVAHFFPSGQECSNMINMLNSSPSISDNGLLAPEKNNVGKKRKRSSDHRETQKPKEVVHVRAKRGQATDSHSLAERLRRGKINEKLRCLQDLVPGCYKTMGMAVMLDVIINYVRSLQNQIDFLSMKLSAASAFYDFNSSEAEAMEALQRSTTYEGGQVMEKVGGDGFGGILQFQTAPNWPL